MMLPWIQVDGLLWAILGLVWLAAAPFSRRTVRTESLASRVGSMAPAILGAFLMWSRDGRLGPLEAHLLPRATWAGVLSVALTAAGVAFALWARATLGRNWSGRVTLKEDHTLVQRGPYALARHPIYTGILLGLVGTAIAVNTIRAALGVPLIALSFLIKIRMEERFMAAQFGAAYADYRRRVRALVPFLF